MAERFSIQILSMVHKYVQSSRVSTMNSLHSSRFFFFPTRKCFAKKNFLSHDSLSIKVKFLLNLFELLFEAEKKLIRYSELITNAHNSL